MKSNLKNEYQEFLKSSDSVPSSRVSSIILEKVHTDLNPSPFKVFSKLLLIHSLTAVVTLSVCPQFGFRILGEGMGLMHIFMAFGQYGCVIACGSFFTGMSLLMGSLVLRVEEIRKIRQNRWLELVLLTLLSLGFFVMMDAELIFGLTVAWFLGAMLGSAATLELGWMLRLKLLQR